MNAKSADQEEAFGAAPHERPVPRISIGAFVEFPDTGAALQRAGADRRLAKAHVNVQLGGIQACIDHYHGQVTPNLLIVETRLNGRAALDELDRLAEVCDPTTKVIVVGRVNDVELYRELMRRGASEYLVAPLNPLHLIEVISGLYLDPEAAPIGRVVAFIGARGGVGSSSLSHNVGWCIAEELRINTTIIDLDLPFGTTGLDFNDEPTQGVADALSAPERLDDVLLDRLLVKRGDHLSIFSTPAMIDREYEASVDAYESVLDAVRQSTPCVIVDVPHVWTPWVKATLIGADDIVIVATPDLAALRNAKNIYELLRQHRPNDTPPRLVINQTGVPKRPEIPAKDFAETIGVQPALVMPFDPQLFGQAANNGQMLNEVAPKSPTAQGIRTLAEVVTGRAPQVVQKSTDLFAFLKGKKKA
ncbi:MAG: CtpF protein [Alphaproteobacteria bacterium]|nr:CtpF protein [Alphaproteobacteria bacterium]MBL6937529.1 CtpF protein [Alphaproteobacteria bacterium]MBL7098867.1 CtpF protein [Alphaproteobacteria bacterium]